MPTDLHLVRSAGPFAVWLRSAIHLLKYQSEWGRIEHLGPLLATAAADAGSYDSIAPVPLHPARLRHRGFNQSHLLAEWAARELDVPVEPFLLRTRATDAQVRLGAEDRRANVSGAFAVAPGATVEGRSILLIDDVITTGSTLGACAAALRAAGAISVSAATIAREV